ncbi:SAM-dependent methyltransferase [Actinophytocola xinjiangensis]|uniref:SAM-dependent methyltransferase n=1 Tax=Actinophytocola xinjiangensis TaxID=485602 RepID=A0A7Z0WJN7_9PSEU|nr:class I SAM-dependent methyltransferase [Actinophytocola xinjiangensis]OLF06709.1 SAM-dependent methyltransferase [Actinophytocola xinjiangensis]
MANDKRVRHPIFSRYYPKLIANLEKAGIGEHRRTLLTGLTGEVVEVGAGNDANFRYYPPTVTRVLAVEPERRLRGLAEAAARDAPVPVEVVDGLAQRLPAADDSADAVICALVLCSVGDQAPVLREIRRILAPGGEFRFFEHVRADTPGMIRAQRVLDATLWPLLAGGCHMGRDTTAAIRDAGFTVTRLDRFRFPDVASPSASHVLGSATL